MTPEAEPPYDDDEPAAAGGAYDAPPHNLEAERIVIGSALQSPTIYEQLARQLDSRDFYLMAHELLWDALAELADRGHPTEPVALLSHLRERRILTKTGGGPYLHTCVQAAAVPASADYYSREVKQLSRRRMALRALQTATQQLQHPDAFNEHGTEETMRTASAALAESVEAIANPNPSTTWAPADLEAALQGKSLDPPPEMLARADGVCLFYSSAVHSISGESESGKTWLTLIAAVQLISAALEVVFIDFEDRAERVVGRLLSLGATPDQIRDHFRYVRPDRALDALGRHELEPHLEHAMLVIVDGVTEAMTLHGYETNDNGDAARFYALLPRWIADHGPGVALIDHVSKDKEKQGRYALGAQHKLAGLDGAAYTVKIVTPFGRGKKGMAKVEVAKDRAGHVREHAVGNRIAELVIDATGVDLIATLDPPAAPSTTASGEFLPTVLMEKVSKYVYGNPDSTTNQILEAVGGKATHTRHAIEVLVKDGYLTVETGVRNSKLHKHANHYPPTDQGEFEDGWPTKEKDAS